MTQAQFAELTGVNKATIVNIENRRQGATLAVLYRIAETLRVDLTSLLPDVEEVRRAREDVRGPTRVEDELPEWADLIPHVTERRAGGENT